MFKRNRIEPEVRPSLVGVRKVGIRILLFFVLIAVFVLLLNIQYFKKQIQFRLHGPESVDTSTAQLRVPVNSEAPVETMEKNTLVIESLGITAPIIYPEEKSETEFQRSLQYGVVQYPGTALVGKPGNTYIFGHSSDYPWSKGNFKTVFALLPNISAGAEIKISDNTGRIFKYAVTKQFVAEKTDTQLLKQDTSKYLLTLQTSYPIGTALKRYIVVAELIP